MQRKNTKDEEVFDRKLWRRKLCLFLGWEKLRVHRKIPVWVSYPTVRFNEITNVLLLAMVPTLCRSVFLKWALPKKMHSSNWRLRLCKHVTVADVLNPILASPSGAYHVSPFLGLYTCIEWVSILLWILFTCFFNWVDIPLRQQYSQFAVYVFILFYFIFRYVLYLAKLLPAVTSSTA